ncbi:aspartyl protease family protein [Belliella marina]|uniref:Aspartyl protease family protein n=1 Tax=Belliella marina TaxID=1644146 RepID=A0ABW4VTM6_9BACT
MIIQRSTAIYGLVIALITLCLVSSFSPKNANHKKTTHSLAVALKSQDLGKFKELISDDFGIGVYEGKSTASMLASLLDLYPKISKVTYVESKEEKGEQRVYIDVQLENGESKNTWYALDQYGKILYLEIFDKAYGIDRKSDKGLVASIPFDFSSGSITIPIKMNDYENPIHMLFDTGADGIGVGSGTAKNIGVNETQDHESSVVGGTKKVQLSKGNTLILGEDIILKNQNLVVFPEYKDTNGGLLGGNILRNFTTKVDFDRSVMELYDFNSYTPSPEAICVPLDYSSGLPAVKLQTQFDSQKDWIPTNLIMDTGASYNLILFSDFVARTQVHQNFKTAASSTNTSFDIVTPTLMGNLNGLRLDGEEINNFLISLQLPAAGNRRIGNYDGSWGIGLIKRYNFTIDLLHKKLYLEPNQYSQYPADLALAGMFLGFDATGDLKVNQVIGGSAADQEGISIGDIIMHIDGEDPIDFLNKPTPFLGKELTFRIIKPDQVIQIELSI